MVPEAIPSRIMRATRVNHVSIVANDLEESARFYEELFGMERVPTAKFPTGGVLWLKAGDQQLHLFESDEDEPTLHHHFGMDVDDFDAVYWKAKELGILDSAAFGEPIRTHPAGWVQLYLRDPAGNLIEVDCPDVSRIDPDILAEATSLESMVHQEGDAAVATLYHEVTRTGVA
jgi:catechol 2,3-dioxygenase-like lactoylglutathione lyase family enzyme